MTAPPPASPAPRPLAVITGASEGLGREFAELYACDGHDLLLVARRGELLREVARDIAARHGVAVEAVVADLATRAGCDAVVAAAEPSRGRLVALVNNAGVGALGHFETLPWEREQAQLDVNIVALTYLSKRMLPWLRSNGRGHVMNLASVASFQPGPLMAVYYASKAYVLSLSEALHNEFGGSGVTVTAVCPGPTETGFQRASGVPSGRRPGGPQLLSAREVALQAYRAARRGRRVVVPGMANRIAAFLGRHMPSGYTAQFVRRIQESRLP